MLMMLLCFIGCRGWTSYKLPIHLNPNMDTQPKYKPYNKSDWFANKMTMRPLVKYVIPQNYLKLNDFYYKGIVNNNFVNNYPDNINITESFIKRGQNRFNIFCAPCHDAAGSGNGLVGEKMHIKPMSLHSEYMYNLKLGQLFNIISNGSRTMPSHNIQIIERDRWAIVAYVKALQFSQNINGD